MIQVATATAAQVEQHDNWKAIRSRLDGRSQIAPLRRSISPRSVATLGDTRVVVDSFDLVNGVSLKPLAGLSSPDVTVAQRILLAVSKASRISRSAIQSRRRSREIVLPRQIGMALCRHFTKMSLPEIERFFGKKDHGAVIWAVKKIEPLIARVEGDFDAAKPIEELAALLVRESQRVRFIAPKNRKGEFYLVDLE